MTNILAIVTVAGLLSLLVLLLWLTYKWPGRKKRGNWRLRLVGVAVGITMVGVGVFLQRSAADPMDLIAMVGLFAVGPGLLIAFFSLMLTSPQEPQESHTKTESEESS